jgi:translocator protein
MTDIIPLALFLVATSAAAITGGLFTPGPWYMALKKPWWTPPGWAFPVVWTLLYIMIAIAGWKAWQAQGLGLLVAVWCVQLILNAMWSWLMFGRKDIQAALIDAGGMWISIAAFTALAWPVSETSALLFVPYLLWVTIAFILNQQILKLNPGA